MPAAKKTPAKKTAPKKTAAKKPTARKTAPKKQSNPDVQVDRETDDIRPRRKTLSARPSDQEREEQRQKELQAQRDEHNRRVGGQ